MRLARCLSTCASTVTLTVCVAFSADAQTPDTIRQQVARERAPLLDTLRDLVNIESGSSDYEGVTRIGQLIGQRLRALGGEVEFVPSAADMPRFENTPAKIADSVVARFRGRGTARILLLAHMDTVYERGMLAKQPFRIDGDKAFGLGIADDKHGVAVILHTLSTLKAIGFDRYGLITVLISPDEEIASPAERELITATAAQHDITFSCEGAGQDDHISLATTGIELAILTVTGRASHAGQAPEAGRNALYELSHQLLQLRDLSNAATGVKVNWTVSKAGSVPNAIPEHAQAIADMRANRMDDFKGVQEEIRRRIRNTLIPDTTVEVRFEEYFPPLPVREQSMRAAEQARRIYGEIGLTLKVATESSGGGTDAAFAAMRTQAPVLEHFGLKNFGAHSNNAEYVEISSIEPRLYLLTRMVMESSSR